MTRLSACRALHATAAAALAGCAPAAPMPAPAAIAELAGRTAGPAQRCIPFQESEAFRMGAPDTVLYGRGAVVWASRLAANCRIGDRSLMLISEPVGANHCRGDLVRSLDPVSRVPGPGCILGDFVPYRR